MPDDTTGCGRDPCRRTPRQSCPLASLIAWSSIARPERKLVLGDRQRWGDPENAPHSGQLHDVHVQAQFKAAFGDERAQLVGTAFGLAVDDQFQTDQQATSPDIAHDLVPARDLLEAMP